MLADAIAAERFRLVRDRTTLFWGFLFVPIVSLLLSAAFDLFVRFTVKQPLPNATTHLAERALKAVADGASPFVALFLLIGAAAILAGDYRWETWRLLTPRNSRPNLLAAKLLVFGEAAAWSLLLMALSGLAAGLFSGMVNGASFVGPDDGAAFLGRFAGVFAITWLQVMVIGALAAVLGVLTRSTMGAVIAGLVATVVQSTIATQLREPTFKALSVPAYAGDLLKAFVLAPADQRPDGGPAGLALLMLLVWLVGLTAAALFAFGRQDLTKE